MPSQFNVSILYYSSRMAATCFVQPLDLVKNRMQVIKVPEGGKKPTTASILFGVVKNEGFTKLYNGLSAGLLRQATYTTTRLGKLFIPAFSSLKSSFLSFFQLFGQAFIPCCLSGFLILTAVRLDSSSKLRWEWLLERQGRLSVRRLR